MALITPEPFCDRARGETRLRIPPCGILPNEHLALPLHSDTSHTKKPHASGKLQNKQQNNYICSWHSWIMHRTPHTAMRYIARRAPRTLPLQGHLAYRKATREWQTLKTKYLPVAQLDSASDSDSEGPRFESAQVGQAPYFFRCFFFLHLIRHFKTSLKMTPSPTREGLIIIL